MESSSPRNEKRKDAAKEALTYWVVGVLFTLFPTFASIGAALYLSKPLAVSNDEIAMLACLVLLPTLLDYFRDSDKRNRADTIYFSVLLLFLAFCGMIYGIARADEWKGITFAPVFLLILSFLLSYAAEMSLRGQMKMDKMEVLRQLQSGLEMCAAILGIFTLAFTFLFSRRESEKTPEKKVDVFVNGRKVKAANLKAEDIAALVNKLDAEEVAALRERMKQADGPTKEE